MHWQRVYIVVVVFAAARWRDADAALVTRARAHAPATDCSAIRLRHGRVRYRKNGFAQAHCAAGYMLAGDRYVKCTGGRWEGVLPMCVRPTCRPPTQPAHGFVYPSHRGAVLNFYCMAGYALTGPATAFCDGARWNAHLPVCAAGGRGNNFTLACDFEADDICGWTHDLNHNFDWTRNAHATPSSFLGTGPPYDHTLGEGGAGHYMYVEASSRNPNDVARLISPAYAPPPNVTALCLTFWYHMYGATTGTLRVYVRPVPPSTEGAHAPWEFDAETAAWTTSGNKGNRWLRAFVRLGHAPDEFQVIIEGVRGGNYLSDMAIDDVEMIAPCGEREEKEAEAVEAGTEEPSSEASAMTPGGTESTVEGAFTAFSCFNRCGTVGGGDECGCADTCSDEQRCCFDYEAWCLDTDNATSTPWTEGTEDTSSTSMSFTSPVMMTSTISHTESVNFTVGVASSTILAKREEPLTTVTSNATPTSHPPTTPTTQQLWVPITDVKRYHYDDVGGGTATDVVVVAQSGRSWSITHASLTIAALGMLVGWVIAVVAVGVRRRWWCVRMRDRRWGGATSQSDVRFLSSEEILDLNLPY